MTFVQLITIPVFFLSGAITPINQLQGIPVLYQLQFVNPLTYGVDAVRSLITAVCNTTMDVQCCRAHILKDGGGLNILDRTFYK